MAWTEQTLAIAASKRLKMDGKSLLTLQSYIPNALNNLARSTANDDFQRRYLLTSPVTAYVEITANTYQGGYSDLTNLIASPQIMLDNLQYGTILWRPKTRSWLPGAVVGYRIGIPLHGYYTGMPVLLTTTNALPSPLILNTVYYVIVLNPNVILVATTLANALADVYIILTDEGVGESSAVPVTDLVAQWVGSPNQGLLDQANPYPYPYIWLEALLLKTNKFNGTFKFNVPFIPTLSTLPVALESDAVDAMVQLAISQGFTPLTTAEK